MNLVVEGHDVSHLGVERRDRLLQLAHHPRFLRGSPTESVRESVRECLCVCLCVCVSVCMWV